MVKLVGILNLTPDSFSDGGVYSTTELAISRALTLADVGADVIDIGAESTRPGATPLTHEEEWRRLEEPLAAIIPVLKNRVKISIDTRHAETARKALALGAHWINDVSGAEDNAMQRVIAEHDCTLVVMHNLGIPADKNITLPQDADVIATVKQWAETRITTLKKVGIPRSRIIIDPGIGFGKTAQQSLHIIKHCVALKSLGVPLLVGHSEKSCFSAITPSPAGQRGAETLTASLYMAQHGVDYLRVHDVAAHHHALTVKDFLHD